MTEGDPGRETLHTRLNRIVPSPPPHMPALQPGSSLGQSLWCECCPVVPGGIWALGFLAFFFPFSFFFFFFLFFWMCFVQQTLCMQCPCCPHCFHSLQSQAASPTSALSSAASPWCQPSHRHFGGSLVVFFLVGLGFLLVFFFLSLFFPFFSPLFNFN